MGKTYGGDLKALRGVYGPAAAFSTLNPPKSLADKTFGSQWQYDWASFHDDEILQHHRYIKSVWNDLGVTDETVLFTTCESFNSLNGGMLPRLDLRQKGGLALATLNVYPKTAGSAAESTLNQPMKGAHDAQLMVASQRDYLRMANPWLMASETMGGWFPPTQVTLGARQHTYSSMLAGGIKALIIYYFHEGYNWSGTEKNDSELHFDAPLDKNLNPTPSFAMIQSLGRALSTGLGASLMGSEMVTTPILIAHDSLSQYS